MDAHSLTPSSAGGLVDDVRSLLAKELCGGAQTLARSARRMAMSARTLQRRLSAAGTSHEELRDEVRRALAMRVLEDRSVPIAEVGFLLGFKDASAFYRAFRRWTGGTPAAYRHRARASRAA